MPESTKSRFRVSVGDLVAVAIQPAHLARGGTSRIRAMDGIREHTRLQDLKSPEWQREVSVSLTLEQETFVLEVFGRMDGLLAEGSRFVVEEIKTCRQEPAVLSRAPRASHLAQLKCYGYMALRQWERDSVTLRLTYARPGTGDTAVHSIDHTLEDLEDFFHSLVSAYTGLLGSRTAWERIRNPSLATLAFPYPEFRTGQRDLAEAVYKIVKHGRILFARAPTGTGKTMAVLFPALKAMGQGLTDKLFYLTAKSPGRTVAQKAVRDLARAGARIKMVTITAKQKTCFTPDIPCDTETCIYARGYYTKLAGAMARAGTTDHFDRTRIEDLAREHEICPFELSLDLSLICDIIICDLNYAFDPRVYLKRFFDRETGRLTFLMDEAHNLPDRLRSMYSADLDRTAVLAAQAVLRDAVPALARSLAAVQREMVRLGRTHLAANESYASTELPGDLTAALDEFAARAELWLDDHPDAPVRETVLDIFYPVNGFLSLARHFGSHYRTFVQRPEDIRVRLFCLDPAPIFSRLIRRCEAAVCFSATFFPFSYYQQVLFGTPEETGDATGRTPPEPAGTPNQSQMPVAHTLSLPSPFPRENFKLVIHPRIKTTYKQRRRYYGDVADTIVRAAALRPGNHIIFFSSYAYMAAVLDQTDPDLLPGEIQVQHPGMDEDERQAFLDAFTRDSRVTGFAVLGGIFGEGIDLEGDRLTTVTVVGVGLPQVNPEQEEIREYYDALEPNPGTGLSEGMDGFFIAYQMPGFNRVLQAVGRLIRSDTDRGMALLVDERFLRPDYQVLFPSEWQGFDTISAPRDLAGIVDEFQAAKPGD